MLLCYFKILNTYANNLKKIFKDNIIYDIMLNKNQYEMITDLMNAIKIAECESWVKNFDDNKNGFMFSTHRNLQKITELMKYNGHSGGSFAFTMRQCQYYISNPEEWIVELNNYNLLSSV